MIATQKTVRKHAFATDVCLPMSWACISFGREQLVWHAPQPDLPTANDNVTQISDLSGPAQAKNRCEPRPEVLTRAT
jgi:hypothetical protein